VSRLPKKPPVLTDPGTTGTISRNRKAGLTSRKPLWDLDNFTNIILPENVKSFHEIILNFIPYFTPEKPLLF
jgi:hypothetical protein